MNEDVQKAAEATIRGLGNARLINPVRGAQAEPHRSVLERLNVLEANLEQLFKFLNERVEQIEARLMRLENMIG